MADVAVPLVTQARLRINEGARHVVIRELQDQMAARGVIVLLTRADGSVIELGDPVPVTHVDLVSDGTSIAVQRGSFRVPGQGDFVFLASPFNLLRGQGAAALLLARPDDAGRLALTDLMRAMLVCSFVSLAISLPTLAAPDPKKPPLEDDAADIAVGMGDCPPLAARGRPLRDRARERPSTP